MSEWIDTDKGQQNAHFKNVDWQCASGFFRFFSTVMHAVPVSQRSEWKFCFWLNSRHGVMFPLARPASSSSIGERGEEGRAWKKAQPGYCRRKKEEERGLDWDGTEEPRKGRRRLEAACWCWRCQSERKRKSPISPTARTPLLLPSNAITSAESNCQPSSRSKERKKKKKPWFLQYFMLSAIWFLLSVPSTVCCIYTKIQYICLKLINTPIVH